MKQNKYVSKKSRAPWGARHPEAPIQSNTPPAALFTVKYIEYREEYDNLEFKMPKNYRPSVDRIGAYYISGRLYAGRAAEVYDN